MLRCSLLLLFVVAHCSCAEYFSATVDMGKALEVGHLLASDLNTYLDIEEARLKRIRRVAERLSSEDSNAVLANEPEEYFGNPVNAYLEVKRLTFNWKSELLKLVDNNFNDDEEDSVSLGHLQLADVRAKVEQHASMLPGHDDLDGAADAIILLQETYKLSTGQLANGILIDNLTCPRLSAAQCMHIGQQAYNSREYLLASEWFQMAYRRLLEDGKQSGSEESDTFGHQDTPTESPHQISVPYEAQPTVESVLDHWSYALGRQARYAEALNVTRLLVQEDPSNQRYLDLETYYTDRIAAGEGIVGPQPPKSQLSQYEQETQDFQATCRGERLKPPPPSSSLYCRHYVPHPYYILAPVKEEVLYPDPRLVMWYEVIHEREIQRIKELAIPKLRRATVKNPVTGKLENARYRTSKSAWLPEDMDEVTRRIRKRIHQLTGLSLETAEDLQVGNYGIGGYYAPHFDFGRKREKDAFEIENGNRIATIIFYLSEIKAGGGTAFTRVGARVDAVRGAAAFWYNLFPSGEGDLRTRHAACPVLLGSKWVMNVWFHERGQEFRRPCELQRGPVEIDDGS